MAALLVAGVLVLGGGMAIALAASAATLLFEWIGCQVDYWRMGRDISRGRR